MRFVWDEKKALLNYQKHGILFQDATAVFDDPLQRTLFDREVEGEERWHTIGMIHGVVVVLVVHALRYEGEDEVVRIISARRADAKERRRYGDGVL